MILFTVFDGLKTMFVYFRLLRVKSSIVAVGFTFPTKKSNSHNAVHRISQDVIWSESQKNRRINLHSKQINKNISNLIKNTVKEKRVFN